MPLKSLGRPQKLESIFFDNFDSIEFSRVRLSCERLDVDILCLLGFCCASPVPIQWRPVHTRATASEAPKDFLKDGENFCQRAARQTFSK